MVAHYHGQVWNGSQIGTSLGVTHHTIRNYLDILTGAYEVRQLQPGSGAQHAGADLDVLVSAKCRRWGFEVKFQDAPTITESMRIALDDLKLEKLWVVYPGRTGYLMDEMIECVSLAQLDQVRSALE